jgi:uncharacterized protein YciI
MEKSIVTTFLFALLIGMTCAQQNKREFEMTMEDTTYTMKQYTFCLYLKGLKTDHPKEEAEEIQKAHLAHISLMAEKNNLVMAGPFGDDTEKRGMMIFDVETQAEAEQALAQDPAVRAGRLVYECHPWWAAKGSTLR